MNEKKAQSVCSGLSLILAAGQETNGGRIDIRARPFVSCNRCLHIVEGWKMENEERPHDYEAERAILCAVLHDNSAIDDLALKPDDFCNPENVVIYRAMLELRNKGQGIDRVLLYDAMRPHRDIVPMGSVLAELRDEAFTAAYVLDYARIVKEKSVKRRMLDALPRIASQIPQRC